MDSIVNKALLASFASTAALTVLPNLAHAQRPPTISGPVQAVSSQSLRAADPLTTPLVPARDATPPLLPRIAHSSSYTTMRSEAARTDFTQPPQGLSIVGPNDSLFNQSGLFPTDPNIKGIGARFQEGNASITVGVMNADKFRVPDRGRSGDKRVVLIQGRISFQGPK